MSNKKICALFSGQGAQYVSMGKDFITQDSNLDPRLKDIMLNGPAEQLNQTINTQPAIYIHSLFAYKEFMKRYPEFNPMVFAGFSLGEVTALTASGYLDSDMKIVSKRAECMNNVGGNYGMAACIGKIDDVQKIIDEARLQILEIANYNSNMQYVISGDIESINKARQVGKSNKIKVLPLKVSTAFHTSVMEPAKQEYSKFLSNITIHDSKKIVYMNQTAMPLKSDLKTMMADQLVSPVLWEQTIKNIQNDIQPDLYIEFGPGKTLTNLVKKIIPDANVYNVDTCQDIDAFTDLI